MQFFTNDFLVLLTCGVVHLAFIAYQRGWSGGMGENCHMAVLSCQDNDECCSLRHLHAKARDRGVVDSLHWVRTRT